MWYLIVFMGIFLAKYFVMTKTEKLNKTFPKKIENCKIIHRSKVTHHSL